MQYSHGTGTLSWGKQLESGAALSLSARHVRQERTGTHALVAILLNDVKLAWSNFNIDRDEDRVRLSNSAYVHFQPAEQKALPKKVLKYYLDEFCGGLWDEHAAQYEAEELTGELDIGPIEYALRPYVVEGGGTVVFAPPGRGKSWTLYLWAVSIDAGCNHLWQVDRPRRTVVVNLERSKMSVRRRLAMANVALGLPPERPLLVLNARGRSLRDMEEGIHRTVAKYSVEVAMLDSISRSGYGDLNDNRTANTIIDTLNGLAETWIAVGHTPRADESHGYGSVLFDAGEDVGIQLLTQRSTNGTLGVGLNMTKANDVPLAPLSVYAYEFDKYGLSGARPANRGEFVEIEAGRKPNVKNDVTELLVAAGALSATDVSQELGKDRSQIARMFAVDPDFVVVRKEAGHVLYGVKGHHDV